MNADEKLEAIKNLPRWDGSDYMGKSYSIEPDGDFLLAEDVYKIIEGDIE